MVERKLYGSLGSRSTMRALAVLYEHQIEFEFIPVDLKAGEHKREPFLSLNPFGQVPVYQDDELILFESRAIMRFVSHYYAKPDNEQVYAVPKMQGIAAGWIDTEDHQFEPPASKLIWELVLKPKSTGMAPDKGIVAEEEAKLGKLLDVYEQRLEECKFLGGNKFTSADLTHLPHLYYLMGTQVERLFNDRKHVKAWHKEILSRPGWLKVVEFLEQGNETHMT